MNRILIIQTAFIGDVILATPLIEAAASRYPQAQIDILVRKGNEGLLIGHPSICTVHIWNKKKQKYKALWSILRRIRQEKYDLVVNCQRFAASGLLTAFSGAPQTVGFDKNPLSFLFSKNIPHHIGNGLHETQRNLLLLEAVGWPSPMDSRPRMYPQKADYEAIKPYADQQPYVCLAPTSVWFTKQWPAHKWVALINKIPSTHTVFLLGGPPDFEACASILALSTSKSSVQNLAGKLSFLASAALMENATMNYVNDSAPLHIASAMNAPVTAIFCSTLPAFGFGPLSENSHIWQTTEKLGCRPCGLHGKKACPLGHFNCAEKIIIPEV